MNSDNESKVEVKVHGYATVDCEEDHENISKKFKNGSGGATGPYRDVQGHSDITKKSQEIPWCPWCPWMVLNVPVSPCKGSLSNLSGASCLRKERNSLSVPECP